MNYKGGLILTANIQESCNITPVFIERSAIQPLVRFENCTASNSTVESDKNILYIVVSWSRIIVIK
jgi:hypothetical protein